MASHKYTYYKNSTTGHLIKRYQFTSCHNLIDFPDIYYDVYGNQIGEDGHMPDLKGYVEITEKKFKRYQRKIKNEKNISNNH